MSVNKWNEENLIDRIEFNKKSINNTLNNWDKLIEANIKNGSKKEVASSRLKSFMAIDAEYIGRSYALLGNGKDAREWFKISTQKNLDSMSSTYFYDTKSLAMLKSAVLSCDKDLAKNASSKILGTGVRKVSTLDIIKRMCELYAAVILNNKISKEYLAEMEECEKKYQKRISGMQPGAIKSCRGIVEKDKNIFLDGLSTMLAFTRRFYGQMKGDIPIATEEAMLIHLARIAGIDIGPSDFPKYADLLPNCLFETDSNLYKKGVDLATIKWTKGQLRKSIEVYKKHIQESENYWNFYVERCTREKNKISEESKALSQYYWGIDPEYIGRSCVLLGDGKEAKKWFEVSAKNRYESMLVLGFYGIRSLRMLWNAVLSGNRELEKNAATGIKNSSINIDYGLDLAKKKCGLYADLILGNTISKECLIELGEIENKQNQLGSGIRFGAVESCQGIINKDKNLFISGISKMLERSVCFFSQVKAEVPIAMEEAMIIILAKNAGINLGLENFPEYKEILPTCLFEIRNAPQ